MLKEKANKSHVSILNFIVKDLYHSLIVLLQLMNGHEL